VAANLLFPLPSQYLSAGTNWKASLGFPPPPNVNSSLWGWSIGRFSHYWAVCPRQLHFSRLRLSRRWLSSGSPLLSPFLIFNKLQFEWANLVVTFPAIDFTPPMFSGFPSRIRAFLRFHPWIFFFLSFTCFQVPPVSARYTFSTLRLFFFTDFLSIRPPLPRPHPPHMVL